jgi:hypothetical protein
MRAPRQKLISRNGQFAKRTFDLPPKSAKGLIKGRKFDFVPQRVLQCVPCAMKI